MYTCRNFLSRYPVPRSELFPTLPYAQDWLGTPTRSVWPPSWSHIGGLSPVPPGLQTHHTSPRHNQLFGSFGHTQPAQPIHPNGLFASVYYLATRYLAGPAAGQSGSSFSPLPLDPATQSAVVHETDSRHKAASLLLQPFYLAATPTGQTYPQLYRPQAQLVWPGAPPVSSGYDGGYTGYSGNPNYGLYSSSIIGLYNNGIAGGLNIAQGSSSSQHSPVGPVAGIAMTLFIGIALTVYCFRRRQQRSITSLDCSVRLPEEGLATSSRAAPVISRLCCLMRGSSRDPRMDCYDPSTCQDHNLTGYCDTPVTAAGPTSKESGDDENELSESLGGQGKHIIGKSFFGRPRTDDDDLGGTGVAVALLLPVEADSSPEINRINHSKPSVRSQEDQSCRSADVYHNDDGDNNNNENDDKDQAGEEATVDKHESGATKLNKLSVVSGSETLLLQTRNDNATAEAMVQPKAVFLSHLTGLNEKTREVAHWGKSMRADLAVPRPGYVEQVRIAKLGGSATIAPSIERNQDAEVWRIVFGAMDMLDLYWFQP
ncbi:unnamed protein product [Protopolystoma xenopodis]|uniref:Uncharacterized protein n=1 Tax=Protopolystoma xenopodis TaxID=117903 RepID=A0A3S5B465_9PLAT|nr:unnamed protein product [Protopolystoma xenopodis]